MKKLLIILCMLSSGCGGEDEETYSLWDDLINGVWILVNEIDEDYNAVDFMQGGSVILYEGNRTADNCTQVEENGLFVLEGNELSLSSGSVMVEIRNDVLTVNEDGSIFTYDRHTESEFETILEDFCL